MAGFIEAVLFMAFLLLFFTDKGARGTQHTQQRSVSDSLSPCRHSRAGSSRQQRAWLERTGALVYSSGGFPCCRQCSRYFLG